MQNNASRANRLHALVSVRTAVIYGATLDSRSAAALAHRRLAVLASRLSAVLARLLYATLAGATITPNSSCQPRSLAHHRRRVILHSGRPVSPKPAPAPPGPAPPAPVSPAPTPAAPPARAAPGPPEAPARVPPAPVPPAATPASPPAPAAPVPLVRAPPGPAAPVRPAAPAPVPPAPTPLAPPAPAPPAPGSPAPVPPTPPAPAAPVPLVQAPPRPAAPAPQGPPALAGTPAPPKLVAPAPPAPVPPVAESPALAAPLRRSVRQATHSRSCCGERGSGREDSRGEAPARPLEQAPHIPCTQCSSVFLPPFLPLVPLVPTSAAYLILPPLLLLLLPLPCCPPPSSGLSTALLPPLLPLFSPSTAAPTPPWFGWSPLLLMHFIVSSLMLPEGERSLHMSWRGEERRRAADLEMRGQVEEREREENAGKGGMAAVQEDAGMEKDVDLQITQSEGDQKTAWEQIKAASQQNFLELTGISGLSDAMLAHVSRMAHLENIILSSSLGFSAEGIKHLYRLPRLEYPDLRGADIAGSALEGIGSLTKLTHLLLQRTKVRDAGLPHLTGLSSLGVLGLGYCKGVTNASMVHVGRLTGLQVLFVQATLVTDNGLQQMTALTNLTTLRLPNGDYVTDDNAHRWIGM
ncbi:unnamed protein product [Closterium sp. NIES-53]